MAMWVCVVGSQSGTNGRRMQQGACREGKCGLRGGEDALKDEGQGGGRPGLTRSRAGVLTNAH